MDSHKRILGILFIVSGVLRIFAMVLLMAFFSIIFPLIIHEVPASDLWAVEWIESFIQIIGWSIIFVFAIPRIIAGIGLLNKAPWAMTMALIFGCLGVFSFPLGTALCGYTIWVYIEDNKAKRAAA
ncbi:MAG: hypothetical protein JNK18_06330 [Cyclobacteriaceae bacterium]|nr:hypothetical protein [Cyclobacteriaceae bacterium]